MELNKETLGAISLAASGRIGRLRADPCYLAPTAADAVNRGWVRDYECLMAAAEHLALRWGDIEARAGECTESPRPPAPDAAEPPEPTASDLLERAWGIIANAYGGDWDTASAASGWQEAACRWRDAYFAAGNTT